MNSTHEVLLVLGPVLCAFGLPLLWLTVTLLPGFRLWCDTLTVLAFGK